MNMQERFINAVKEYDKKGFSKGKNSQGDFYLSDFHAVLEMGKDENGETQIFDTLLYAMKGAFVLGYRAAKREEKGKQAEGGQEEQQQPASAKDRQTGGVFNLNLNADEMIFAYETWIDLMLAGGLADSKRFNAEFMKHYPKMASEQAPFVLMFNAFVGAIDLVELFESEEFNALLKQAKEAQPEGQQEDDS